MYSLSFSDTDDDGPAAYPMYTFLSPDELFIPVLAPNAVLLSPEDRVCSALFPITTFSSLVVAFCKLLIPSVVLYVPSIFRLALSPIPILLLDPVAEYPARRPINIFPSWSLIDILAPDPVIVSLLFRKLKLVSPWKDPVFPVAVITFPRSLPIIETDPLSFIPMAIST